MYTDLKNALVISTGPKDIARSPLIRSINEESALKMKSCRLQQDEFNINALADVNVLIFSNRTITEQDYENIITCANLSAIFIFGRNDDELLHKMIPQAEEYFKWTSICEFCLLDGHYDVDGVVACRACKMDIKNKEKIKQRNREGRTNNLNRAKKRKLSFSPDTTSSSVEFVDETNKNDEETLPSMTTINNSPAPSQVSKQKNHVTSVIYSRFLVYNRKLVLQRQSSLKRFNEKVVSPLKMCKGILLSSAKH